MEVPVEVKKHCEKLIVSKKKKPKKLIILETSNFLMKRLINWDIWADDMKISLEKEIKDLDSGN